MGEVLLKSSSPLVLVFLVTLAGASFTQAQDFDCEADSTYGYETVAEGLGSMSGGVHERSVANGATVSVHANDCLSAGDAPLIYARRSDALATGSEVNSIWTAAGGRDNDGDGHNTGVRVCSKRSTWCRATETNTASRTAP